MMSNVGAAAAAVTALAGSRKAVQLYPATHPAYGEAVAELERAIREAAAAEPFVLNQHQGRLYHGSLPIPDDVPGLPQVAETFESLSIESLVFHANFSASDAVALTEILSLRPSPDLNLSNELASRGVTSVVASLLARTDEDGDGSGRDVEREQDRALFRRSVSSIRNMLQQVAAGDLSAVTEARSLSESVIPRLSEDVAAVLAMAAARRPADRQLYHSLNVMNYSMVLGHRMGLPSEGLASLGTAAVLHDIGKSAFDPSDPEQAERMRVEHPKVGAEMLQELALDDVAPMLVAYEHHMYANGSGYPAREPGYVAHPYSRIVSITDRFENLTSPPPGTRALTPDRALVQVLREANTYFDPFLARLFANALGPFPVGSVVRLSDHSVGVVLRSGIDPLRPMVRLSYDSNGLEINESEDLDLSQSTVSIVEIIPPEALDVDVSELF